MLPNKTHGCHTLILEKYGIDRNLILNRLNQTSKREIADFMQQTGQFQQETDQFKLN